MLWLNLRRLKSTDWRTRARALKALAGVTSEPVETARVRLLLDEQRDIRRAAVETLRTAPGKAAAVAVLRQWLQGPTPETPGDPDWLRRREAVRHLGTLGDPTCVDTLVIALTEEGTRDLAQEALLKIDPDWRKSAAARTAVLHLVSSVDRLGHYAKAGLAELATQVLGHEALRLLERLLADHDQGIQQRAADQLLALPPEYVAPLISRARDAIPFFLRALPDDRAVELLKRVDGGACMVSALVAILAKQPDQERIDEERALRAEIQDLRSRPYGGPRLAHELETGRLQHIQDILKPGDDSRCAAALALGKIGGAAAVAALCRATADSAVTVRREALRALARCRDSSSVPTLLSALNDHDEWAATLAAEALCTIGDTGAAHPLSVSLRSPHKELRCAAARALGCFGDASVAEVLIGALSDAYGDVVAAAAVSLGMLESRGATDALRKCFRGTTLGSGAHIGVPVLWALGMIRDVSVSDYLAMHIGDEVPSVRVMAALALAQIAGEEDARRHIRQCPWPDFTMERYEKVIQQGVQFSEMLGHRQCSWPDLTLERYGVVIRQGVHFSGKLGHLV